MNVLVRIFDWLKYERLAHYPALSEFDRDEALKRLKAYSREEREACKYQLRIAWTVTALFMAAWLAIAIANPIVGATTGLLMQIPPWILQYLLHRRIKRRVNAKVAAELRDGRLWTCIECGYDLRASQDRCPECGASIRVTPIS